MIINTLEKLHRILKNTKPIIGIDYGEKKTGLAISTPDHSFAMPFQLIINYSQKDKIKKITYIIKSLEICAVIMGLPLNMNGTTSIQTNIIKHFTYKLNNKLKNIPIFFQDERLTSKMANNSLKLLGIKRKNRNANDDLISANIILNITLNSIKNLENQ